MPSLLTTNQYKFDKTGRNTPFIVIGLQLNPDITIFDGGERLNLCPYAGECASVCLDKAGQNAAPSAVAARHRRTMLYYYDFPTFEKLLTKELKHFWVDAGIDGWVRLNTLSDTRWEDKLGFDWFTQWEGMLGGFYDYTKWPMAKRHTLPPNYHLTYSWSERTDEHEFWDNIESGRNVAVTMFVCRNKYAGDCRHGCHCPLPSHFKGVQVLDGDEHDARFDDPPERVVGLRLKRPRGGSMTLWEIIERAIQARDRGEPSFVQVPEIVII